MDELNVLLDELRKETGLLQERISLESLTVAFNEGRMIFEKDEVGHFIAIAIVQRMRSCIAQVEIGPIWVHRDHRGNGLAHKVVRRAVQFRPGLSCFLIATCDQAANIARTCGFLEVQWLRWHMSCETDCQLFAARPGIAPMKCRFRGNSARRMFRFFAPITDASGL